MKATQTPGAIAARRMGRNRTQPNLDVIGEQRQRIDTLSERIGILMGQRADEEEVLAAMHAQLSSTDREALGLPAAKSREEMSIE